MQFSPSPAQFAGEGGRGVRVLRRRRIGSPRLTFPAARASTLR